MKQRPIESAGESRHSILDRATHPVVWTNDRKWPASGPLRPESVRDFCGSE